MLKIPDSGLQSLQYRMQLPSGRAIGGKPLIPTRCLKQFPRFGAEGTDPRAQPLALGGRTLPLAVAGPGLRCPAQVQAESLNHLSPLFLPSPHAS